MDDTYKQITRKQYDILRDIPENIKESYSDKILFLAKENDKIIDVGFGSGSILIPLSERNINAQIFGIDYSEPLSNAVKNEVGDKAMIITGNVFDHEQKYAIVHFKAILHCFENPQEALDKIKTLTEKDGYIITGHENSQIEDRIEQIFNASTDDTELESLFKFYFSLRKSIGKPFQKRNYPAGNASNAVKYICKDGNFKLIETVSDNNLIWEREYCLNDLMYSIANSTYNVFNFGLSIEEKKYLHSSLVTFSKKQRLDLKRKRKIPANFTLYIIKRVN